jgi:D-alanyl-D-alanine carboxypeptidase
MQIVAALLLAVLFCTACGKKAEPSLDYGDSALYTKEEMDTAIALIRAEFAGWEGCELHSLRYAGDECQNPENVHWLGELAEARGTEARITRCMEFVSDFHSPRKAIDAWNPDEEYTDWQWWLAGTEDGDWLLLTWGY